MKRILILLILLSFAFGQNDNIGSEAVKKTFDANLHLPRDRTFSSGVLVVLRSLEDGASIDSSGMAISDTSVGARAGAHLIQDGSVFYASAADIDLLKDFVDSGYSIVIDSSGYLLDVPRTVYGWSHELTFSATDYNTIEWTSGDLYFANKDTFEIVSGNTGNISDPTWIYFDEDISPTVLQTTTTSGNSVGLGRIIVCVGEDVTSPKDAVFQVFGNSGNGVLILADNIVANTITFNEIAGNTIRTNELSFTPVEDDNVIAFINASSEGLHITGDRININGATTFAANYDPSDGSMVIYQFSAPGTRPSGDALQNGDSWVDTTSAEGNIPKVWTGSEWRIAFTYIHGGYIKTGTIDVGRINAIASSGSGARIVIDPATDKIYFYNATQEVLRIGEDIFGSIDGLAIDSGMVYISTKDNGAYSQLHIENFAQSGTGWQGLQTLYLSNDASSSVTVNPANAWVVSKIEGERNSANPLYGIWSNITNASSGETIGAYYNVSGTGVKSGVEVAVGGASGNAKGFESYTTGSGANNYAVFGSAFGATTDYGGWFAGVGSGTNYGIYALAENGTTNWAGYFEGNVNVTGTLDAPTLNTGQGDNELYDMNQNVETSNTVRFAKVEIDGATNYIDTDTGELELISNGAMNFYASGDGFIFNDDLAVGANKLIGATLNTGQGDNNLFDMNQNVQTSDAVTFTTVGIAELASAPNHTAGIGKLWAKNDTFAPLRYTTDNGEDLWVSVAEVKTTTGHPSGWEGKIEINTFDDKVYIYAEGIWRQLATW